MLQSGRRLRHISQKRGAAEDILAGRKKRKAYNEVARQRCTAYVTNYFATHSCTVSGESKPVVLTFGHVRGTERTNVSGKIRDRLGLETIKAEIKKCDVGNAWRMLLLVLLYFPDFP